MAMFNHPLGGWAGDGGYRGGGAAQQRPHDLRPLQDRGGAQESHADRCRPGKKIRLITFLEI